MGIESSNASPSRIRGGLGAAAEFFLAPVVSGEMVVLYFARGWLYYHSRGANSSEVRLYVSRAILFNATCNYEYKKQLAFLFIRPSALAGQQVESPPAPGLGLRRGV